MAPGNNERHPGHTGTIPKTKARNNCNVPQEAVTPTRRDMTTNLVSTSLDWVPVSEYNRTNYNQSRKPSNNTSDQELTDLDNSVAFESGFGRFVPVRPQPRALPLNVQNRDSVTSDHNDDGAGSTASGHTLHPYGHQMPNGLIPHSNHAAAAVMIVNPTTPNAVNATNTSQQLNTSNQNRNNLTRNINSARNHFESNSSNNNNPTVSNSRSGPKTVNLINNMYDQGQGSLNNLNDNSHIHRESARALGEAIVAACPDAAAVERRLGQIREYIRVTSSLVDTMRSSEDEQDIVVRPISVQSNGSAYSENELWQNEIKNKMEMSQIRLAALKQQQKRLLKYQEEAKQQLEHINRERQTQEMQASTSHDNFAGLQNQSLGSNYHHHNRMYAANQIGVATTLPHSSENIHTQQNISSMENDHGHSTHSSHSRSHSHDDRYSSREANVPHTQEVATEERDSECEEDSPLAERARMLQMKLRELQMKKQHMENLVSEFQKLQMATHMTPSRNTYSSSGDESPDDEPSRKCNRSGNNINKNEDAFKLMEIKAIKAALQKTKDLMRSVEKYESDQLSSVHDDSFQIASHPSHSNVNDNKSEGGGSVGGWSHDGSVCRVRNSLPPPHRHKLTNAQQVHHPQQQSSHEANISALQDLAQELRMETEKIMGERARLKDLVSNKGESRKQKKVNEEIRPSSSAPGPVERRQMELRAILAEKQRELDALINKEKSLVSTSEVQKINQNSCNASVINHSYASEQEEPDSRSEPILLDSQNSGGTDNYRGGTDNSLAGRSLNAGPSHLGSNYASDSDSASRNKLNQRNRQRRRPQERQSDENTTQSSNSNQNVRQEQRTAEVSNVNMVPPISQQAGDNGGTTSYPPMQQPCWSSKSNQDMRTNQFTQNSHSQTMERLLGTPQMSFPPSMPINMMMPYGMVGGCGCGCGFWGAWCWQQLVLQQREIQQLREQINHLEERWRVETASHTLNNQVPPGNRANNYWDNFRSYSRQNLLSANSKMNADSHLGAAPNHNPHPLVERSHNTLHHSSTNSPSVTPKRNTNVAPTSQNAQTSTNNEEVINRQPRRNVAYERSLSFSSAPDVLNVNQNTDTETSAASHSRYSDEVGTGNISSVNINRHDSPNSFRNLNISNPIPEIIQAHSNNLNTPTNSKKKSSSKLPAKNSANRRNYSLDYCQASNINIASTSEPPNPNLASTSHEMHDKATSKLFDLLRENVYSEVTTLIDVNESHPDFLIQLFRELQAISSDPLRQKVLQSIRNVLTQYSTLLEGQNNITNNDDSSNEAAGNSVETSNFRSIECDANSNQNFVTNNSSCIQIDNRIVRFLSLKSDEIFTPELLEALISNILDNRENVPVGQTRKMLLEFLIKYEGLRVGDVSEEIIDNVPELLSSRSDGESNNATSEISESAILQDVAGSLNLFRSNEVQLHTVNSCPYDIWPGHVHMDLEGADMNDNSARSSQEGKVDLINCSEMHNGDLAEADQTCHSETMEAIGGSNHEDIGANAEALPDVVDTDEVTPTEAEAEWFGLDRVPTRLHMEQSSEKQKD